MRRTLIIPTLLGLLWTMLLTALFLWSIVGEQRHVTELAEFQAKAMFQQIVATRSWNSANGGVFVPMGEGVEPNPYLPEDERTLRLENGQSLVKINPAFMTRQIAEIAAARNDVRFHITSLLPVRPENAPDSWERETLGMLTPGQDRFELVPSSDGAGKFRYMAPLICETSCIQCHAKDQVGSVRGGITVSIPAGPLLGYQGANLKKQTVAYGIIWIIGLLGLGGTSYELNRRKELAEASNQTKSRFLANMSHDMRTPLTGILGLTERMLLGHSLDDRDTRYAKLISHSARTLLEVVNDILDYSRIDSGRLELENQPFDVRLAVNKIASIFAFAAQEKGLTFTTQVESTVPAMLIGDEFRYRQVLANLLGNAVKFTDRGSVCLAVSAEGIGHGEYALLSKVEDSGVGIGQHDHETIFGCFNQVDGSLSRRHAGSGLGLSIARQLARSMGGDITVSSQPGLGSAFTFTARLREASRVSAPEAETRKDQTRETAPQGSLVGRKVLVVDDHRANRILLFDILEEQRALPKMASGGEEALSLARHEMWDLILMDLQMPGMGGVEAIERLRDFEREMGRARTPVIVLTAFASPGDVVDLPADEIDGLVEKPIDVPLLLRTMSAALSGRRELSPQVLSGNRQSEINGSAALLDIDPALRLLNGRRDFYAMLASEFFNCSDELRSDFVNAVANGDHREAARIAHTIKASAAALGANRLGNMAADLERLAKGHDTVSAEQCKSLEGLFSQTLKALRDAVPLH